MKITFFGGINEIGGNKILIEEKGTSIFLDFGKSYKESSLYFEEFVSPRAVHGIKDYLALDLIPQKRGIYRKDLVEILEKENYEISSYDKLSLSAILLSHPHMDHAGYLSFIDEKIPVYLTKNSLLVLETFNIIKPSNLENEIFEISYPHYFDSKKRKKQKRNFKEVSNLKGFRINDLEITPIAVDHSAPGATMFLIKSKDKKILYSGDFRLSEIDKEHLEKITSYLKKEKIDYFLCEGTRITEDKVLREKEVYIKAKERILDIKGLIVADYSLTDTTRFLTLQNLAKSINRKIALPFNYFGYLIFLKEKGFNIDISKNVILYGKKKSKLKKWEKNLIKKYPFVEADEIQKNQKDYFVILNFYQIQELIDLKPDENSYFLRAITEPHSEEMEISEARFVNWIKHFEMQGLTEEGKFERAHISGHISGKELKDFISKIQPHFIIPIHTEQPQEFKKIHKNVLIVKKGETITI